MKVICDHCGKEFEKFKCHIKRTEHNFCDLDCKGAYFRNESLDGRYSIDDNGCWNFNGSLNTWGYGSIRYRGKNTAAHRLSFALNNPSVDISGVSVLHKCDNRRCINPDHLFLGDNFTNMADMWSKGRGNSKLSSTDVLDIRISKEMAPMLAKKYGVCVSTIYHARNKKNWKHIKE